MFESLSQISQYSNRSRSLSLRVSSILSPLSSFTLTFELIVSVFSNSGLPLISSNGLIILCAIQRQSCGGSLQSVTSNKTSSHGTYDAKISSLLMNSDGSPETSCSC